MEKRWCTSFVDDVSPDEASRKEVKRLFDLLIANNFLLEPADVYRNMNYELLQSSFELLQEIEPTTIFISYKRDQSSAFALLTLKYLKQFDLEAFLDLSIDPGDNWHASLEKKIEDCQFMVLLLGKTTLSSENVCKEIMWALDQKKEIIPIRQPDFSFCNIVWPDNLSLEVQEKISKKVNLTNAIRIQEESALEYHKAMTALLNRFGITP